MEMYQEKVKIRSCHADMYGTWTPSSILEFMQETAGEHSASFGLDRKTMDSMNIAWVVTRLKVDFECVPKVGDEIVIRTFPTKARHSMFPRSHVFLTKEGHEIGKAVSIWVLIDLHSRKIVNNDYVSERVPDNDGVQMAGSMPVSVQMLEGDLIKGYLSPRFSEIDMNGHVNNTKYMNWLTDAIGMDILKSKYISQFDVNYYAEILPGTDIHTETVIVNNRFSFFACSGGKRYFAAGGILKDRMREDTNR